MNKPSIARKFSVGDAFVPGRDFLNALVSAGQDSKRGEDANPETFAATLSQVDVLIKNDSAQDYGQYDVVGLGDALIDPMADLLEFLRIPAFHSDLPVNPSDIDNWAICLEPIEVGKFGMARTAGVCFAGITAGSSDPVEAFAEIVSGSVNLAFGTSGSAKVLWAEATGTDRWALVRIGAGGSGGGPLGTLINGWAFFHIPSQTVPTGARTYLTMTGGGNYTFDGLSVPGDGGGQLGDAPVGSHYLQAGSGFPADLPAGTVPAGCIGGAWLQWDSGSTGKVTLELPIGPVAFSGSPATAPGVVQASCGNDRQSVSFAFEGEVGFYVAATQNSGGNRTVEGYAWIQLVGLAPGGTPGPGDLAASIAADVPNATTTFTNLSDLAVTLAAGQKYSGRLDIKCGNTTPAEGIKFDFNGGTATMTDFWAGAGVVASSGSAIPGTVVVTAISNPMNFPTMVVDAVLTIVFSIECLAGGTFIPRFAADTHSTGTATIRKGTNLRLEPVG